MTKIQSDFCDVDQTDVELLVPNHPPHSDFYYGDMHTFVYKRLDAYQTAKFKTHWEVKIYTGLGIDTWGFVRWYLINISRRRTRHLAQRQTIGFFEIAPNFVLLLPSEVCVVVFNSFSSSFVVLFVLGGNW